MKEFKKLNYDEYLYWYGHIKEGLPIGEAIKTGVCDYYIIASDDKIYGDLQVFKDEGNEVNLNICNALNFEYDLTMEFLKDTYGKITFVQDSKLYGNDFLSKIKKSYKVIKESEKIVNDIISLNSITVDLTKTK